MNTYIVITNDNKVIASPRVEVFRDGHYTGSSTSLGYDKTHERALEIARTYAQSYTTPVIVDLWDRKYTLRVLFRFLRMFCK